MTKIRVIVFLLTLFIVGTLGLFASLYARGYRLDSKNLKFTPNGLLVAKSEPSGAQIFINGELKSATDTTISLHPGTYDIEFKKDGFMTWAKRLAVEKEVVTLANAHLFKTIPSLTPISFSGSLSPIISGDSARIAYGVPAKNGDSQGGLWVIETANLPLGFSREPRQITDGDVTNASWQFSPDGREIMLTTQTGVFVLDAGSFTPQNQRVNIASRKSEVLNLWNKKANLKLQAQLESIEPEIADILTRKAIFLSFSPDETKVLYQANSEAIIPTGVAKELPGASTQAQERDIKTGPTYVYDIKEDRNFLIEEDSHSLEIGNWKLEVKPTKRLSWFATSNNLLLAGVDKVVIMDYDGTNRQTVYSGAYMAPNAFPILSNDRILILTSLGAVETPPNLYAVTIK